MIFVKTGVMLPYFVPLLTATAAIWGVITNLCPILLEFRSYVKNKRELNEEGFAGKDVH